MLHHDMPINVLRVARARILACPEDGDRKGLEASQVTFEQHRSETQKVTRKEVSPHQRGDRNMVNSER